MLDVADGHPFAVHGQDFLFQFIRTGLMLFQQLGGKFAVAVTRELDRRIARRRS
jgi:hypothetical protein